MLRLGRLVLEIFFERIDHRLSREYAAIRKRRLPHEHLNNHQEEHAFTRTLPDLISAALPSLLLVIYRGAFNLFPRGIGCVNGYRAGFAIGRYHDPTRNRDLLAFLTREG